MSEEIAPVTTPEAPAAPAPTTAPATPAASPESASATPASSPAATPPVEVTAENASEVLADLDPATRRALLFEDPPAKAEVGSGKAEVTEPAATPATPAEPAPAEPEAEPEGEDEITKNFRIHTDDPKESAFFKAFKAAKRTNPNVNPAEVARLVGYDLPGGTAAAASGDPAAPENVPGLETANTPPEVKALQDEITALQTQLDERRDELISADYNKLSTELRAKERALLKLEIKAEQEAERDAEREQGERQSKRQESKAAVLADWPTANDDQSPLGKEIARLYKDMLDDPAHPLRAEHGKDNFPAILTAAAVQSKTAELKAFGLSDAQALEVVKTGKLGGAAKSGPPNGKPATPQTAPVPRNTLVTAPGGNPAPEPVTLDLATVMEAARNDPALRRAALGFADSYVIT